MGIYYGRDARLRAGPRAFRLNRRSGKVASTTGQRANTPGSPSASSCGSARRPTARRWGGRRGAGREQGKHTLVERAPQRSSGGRRGHGPPRTCRTAGTPRGTAGSSLTTGWGTSQVSRARRRLAREPPASCSCRGIAGGSGAWHGPTGPTGGLRHSGEWRRRPSRPWRRRSASRREAPMSRRATLKNVLEPRDRGLKSCLS